MVVSANLSSNKRIISYILFLYFLSDVGSAIDLFHLPSSVYFVLLVFLDYFIVREYIVCRKSRLTSVHRLINIYCCYLLVVFVIGVFLSVNTYVRGISISLIPLAFLPLSIVLFSDYKFCLYILSKIVITICPIMLCVLVYRFVIGKEVFMGLSTYLCFIVIPFFKLLRRKDKCIISLLFIVIMCGAFETDRRAVLLYGGCILIFTILNNKIPVLIMRNLHFFIFPILIFLGFVMFSSSFTSLNEDTESMAYDSRSFLYLEIFSHLNNNNAFLFGTTQGVGYHTIMEDDNIVEDGIVVGTTYEYLKYGRQMSESEFANIIHWGGLANLVFVCMIFWKILKAIDINSKNSIVRIVSLFVIFRFGFMYVDGNISYVFQYLSMWLLIGLALNKDFCNMSEKEINIYC